MKTVKTASTKVTREWTTALAAVNKYASKPNSRAFKAATKKFRQVLTRMCAEARKHA